MRTAFLLVAVLIASPAQAQMIRGQASAVDGDTLNMTGMAVSLYGIDAPETGQTCDRAGETWACGAEAGALLSQLVEGREIACEQQYQAQEQIIAVCKVGRTDLSDAMIRAGYAVALTQVSDAYVDAEAQAKAASSGLWTSTFEPPADYRAAHPAPRLAVRAEPEPAPGVYYRGCNEVRAAGAAPLYRGQPGYRPEMDGDSDGVACEPYRRRR